MLILLNISIMFLVNEMILKYNNKKIELEDCKTFKKRLIGFMFKTDINKALLFKNCNSIHTFFMKTNIDVIMCDKNDNIVYYYGNLPKGKVILPKKDAVYTIEAPTNYFDFKVGDKIEII